MVEQLKREGVRYAFTVPGESFLSVLDALYDEPSLSLGAHGTRITNRRDFAPALEHALALKRPALIEVITDPNQIAVGTTIERLRVRAPSGQDGQHED